jgi:long-subunit acyl-CoA synthetase (AMP-forming)
MRLLHIPQVGELLEAGDVPRYKFTKTFEEAKEDLWLVLHTSGSTGFPKPVFLTHEWVSSIDTIHTMSSYEQVTLMNFSNRRMLCGLPPFHVSM